MDLEADLINTMLLHIHYPPESTILQIPLTQNDLEAIGKPNLKFLGGSHTPPEHSRKNSFSCF